MRTFSDVVDLIVSCVSCVCVPQLLQLADSMMVELEHAQASAEAATGAKRARYYGRLHVLSAVRDQVFVLPVWRALWTENADALDTIEAPKAVRLRSGRAHV